MYKTFVKNSRPSTNKLTKLHHNVAGYLASSTHPYPQTSPKTRAQGDCDSLLRPIMIRSITHANKKEFEGLYNPFVRDVCAVAVERNEVEKIVDGALQDIVPSVRQGLGELVGKKVTPKYIHKICERLKRSKEVQHLDKVNQVVYLWYNNYADNLDAVEVAELEDIPKRMDEYDEEDYEEDDKEDEEEEDGEENEEEDQVGDGEGDEATGAEHSGLEQYYAEDDVTPLFVR